MKKYLLSIAIIFFLSIEIKAHVDHYSKYNYLEYELFRNNKLIGYHKYNFKRDKDHLTIDNEVSFKITKLGIDLYKYYAKGEERYENGTFSGFNSTTNQNKKEKYVNITLDPKDNNLIIDGSSFKGKEEVKIGDKVYKTLRFNFSSSDPSLSKDKKLNTDIWYEEETYLWIKAAFDKTGYWEYRLKKVK